MKKYFKIIVSSILVLSLMMIFTGCNEQKKAETTVTNFLEAIKLNNLEDAKQYANLDKAGLDLNKDDEKNNSSDETAKYILTKISENLSYEIVSSEKIDKENVNIVVKITSLNMDSIYRNAFSEMMKYAFAQAFSDEQTTEEEDNVAFNKILKDELEKDDLEKIVSDVTIKVSKVDKNWIVMADEKLSDAILGGLLSTIDEIDESMANFGSDDEDTESSVTEQIEENTLAS